MSGFTLTVHVQARERVISVRPSGAGGYVLSGDGIEMREARTLGQVVSWALEGVRRYFDAGLRRSELKWGLRVAIPCGTFSFGDWSFEPLVGGGRFHEEEPIVKLFREWADPNEPQSALTGTRLLIR